VTGLTLCMIVRDEEKRLPACLVSVSGLVDEIVVVDTGSTDGTRGIACDFGATVIDHRFVPVDFAAARNHGLDAAHGAFVLVLDADEVLHPDSDAVVRDLVAEGDDVGWIVTRRNFRRGSGGSGGGSGGGEPDWVDHAVRLFPNREQYRFRSRVHETVDESVLAGGGRLQLSGIVVDHHLPADDVLRAKWQWYVDLLRADLVIDPDDSGRLVFLMADYHKLGRYAEATETAERVAELCPDDFTAQLQAALCTFHYTHDLHRARRYLSAALAMRPNDPEARLLATALH
jgi:glycosyltransferase involved in cell wall biosynthesis